MHLAHIEDKKGVASVEPRRADAGPSCSQYRRAEGVGLSGEVGKIYAGEDPVLLILQDMSRHLAGIEGKEDVGSEGNHATVGPLGQELKQPGVEGGPIQTVGPAGMVPDVPSCVMAGMSVPPVPGPTPALPVPGAEVFDDRDHIGLGVPEGPQIPHFSRAPKPVCLGPLLNWMLLYPKKGGFFMFS